VALFDVIDTRNWKGYRYSVRRVMRVIEPTIGKHGQALLVPDIEGELVGPTEAWSRRPSLRCMPTTAPTVTIWS
jgi:hypothetical protein